MQTFLLKFRITLYIAVPESDSRCHATVQIPCFNRSNLQRLMANLEKCCNDTINYDFQVVEFHSNDSQPFWLMRQRAWVLNLGAWWQLENQLIPGMETYSVFYPNKTLTDITVVGDVRGKFRCFRFEAPTLICCLFTTNLPGRYAMSH